MSSPVSSIEQFRVRKAELVAKWGDKLLFHTVEELSAIRVDCEPLARYAKMPWSRIHMALIRDHSTPTEGATK